MKKLIIAANWKLYVTDSEEVKKLASQFKRAASKWKGIDLIVMPTMPFISTLTTTFKRSSVSVGAQNISPFVHGPYTGYESPAVLKGIGAQWALIGHSERRAPTINGVQAAGETEELIEAQVQAAADAGLSIMLCIGELERDPQGAHFNGIERQLSSALARVVGKKGLKLAVAYEPVWAIGKSAADACKPADLEEMTIFIRRSLTELFDRTTATKIPILYGGSVDATNARELLVQGGVAGFLVGRASTNAKSLLEIITAVQTKLK